MSTARKSPVHRGRIWISSPARKQNYAFDSRGHRKGKRDIKGCFKKSSGCPGTGAEGIRAKTKSLGGQRSSAVALAVGAAKARTHNGKQAFILLF